MKIFLLSGAYKNAGDFLIEERTKYILSHVYPESQLCVCLRNEVHKKLNEINKSDAVVIGGGPIYMKNLENYIPIDSYMNITAPMMIVGSGWYGYNGGKNVTKNYKFNKKTYSLLAKIDKEGLGLGCRDLYTMQILKQEGFDNIMMTGCPAWYDIPNINKTELNESHNFNNIFISDPADEINDVQAILVTQYLKRKYPNANISFIFHRGIKTSRKLYENIKKIENVRIIDISNSSSGFEEYRNCDLHVGYRVHAHIYNLSIRNKTVLIEEDGRGAGVNETLGLPSIRAYNDLISTDSKLTHAFYKRSHYYKNEKVLVELDNYLDLLQETDFQYIKNAFTLQKAYWNNMVRFVSQINK